QADGDRDQPQVGDGFLGQEAGAERNADRHGEDHGEGQILASYHPPRGAVLPSALGEEQRQHHYVVKVGDGEQADRFRDEARTHGWTVFLRFARLTRRADAGCSLTTYTPPWCAGRDDPCG